MTSYATRGEICVKAFCLAFAIAFPLQKAVGADAPFALTRPALQISSTNATLNGAVAGNSGNGLAWFEVGTNASYGFQTPPVAMDGSLPIIFLNNQFGGVTPNVAFHYRVVASNSFGITYGADQVFAASRKVVPWGNDSHGQANVPANLTSASVIAASGGYSAALQSDGKLVVWGEDALGLLAPPSGLPTISDFRAGARHLVAVTTGGGVIAWGANGYGQTNVAVGLAGVVGVAAGANHSLALKSDGTLAAWGNNAGELAGAASNLTRVAAIAAGGDHSLALRIDGTVAAWGLNNSGETDVPANLSNVVAIAAGPFHSLALKADGTVIAWGSGQFGQTAVPPALANVVGIAAGAYHNVALKADGTVTGWGYNGSGQISPPSGLTRVVALAAGTDNSLGLVLELQPVALPQMVDGPIGSDLAISLSGNDPRNFPLLAKITSLPTVGTLYQYVSGSRGAAITSLNTVVIDSQSRVIFAPIGGGQGSPYDSFQFRVEEPLAGGLISDSAFVSINIGTGPRPVISQFANDQTGFTLGFNGVSTSNYSVLGSSTLSNWTVLGSATLVSNSFFQYKDTSSNAFRYYRIRTP
ncbi:MAG: hypothetical protein JWM16_2102 [Verrucomicrobiales bacterium]|nr:hypothetical protein [Verrucomicrobiales bacterium]